MNETEMAQNTKKKAARREETEFNSKAIAKEITNLLAQHKVPVEAMDTIIDALYKEIGKQIVQTPEMEFTSDDFIRHFLEHDFSLNPQENKR